HDRVVVRRIEEDAMSAGGIVLPDTASEKPSQGEVLAVGPGKVDDDGDRRALDVAVGDKIIFGQYAGSTVKVDGEELLILGESEIFGVLEG
ncbi:MAG: co-chaperone GroES, partial [Gammaproteobacteria bacterium]|nr:co-chaperone GroES [Gammaproteobacteria bacterium]